MGCQLLIVEDDDLTTESLAEIFEARGFAVESAPNGRAAFDLVRKLGLRPNAIILDMEMPVMGGLDFLRLQGTEPLLSGVSVIVVSAHLPALTQTGIIYAMIRKPYAIQTLVETVERACAPGR